MARNLSDLADTGPEVLDLYGDSDFTARRLHAHALARQMDALLLGLFRWSEFRPHP
jgi:hypothetical protein